MPLYRCDHCHGWRLRTARAAALHDTAHWYEMLRERLVRSTSSLPAPRHPADPLIVTV